MTQPSFIHPTPSDLISLTQIPLRHRKPLLDWLDRRVLDRNEKPVIPHGLYEFWLDNFSDRQPKNALLDF